MQLLLEIGQTSPNILGFLMIVIDALDECEQREDI